MEYLKQFLLILLVTINIVTCKGKRVAVFEHAEQSRLTSGSPEDIILSNLEYYERAALVASTMSVQLVVFPEYGLFPPMSSRKEVRKFLELIPDPRFEQIIPCGDPAKYSSRPILYSLSCIARKTGLILVANMGDIQACKGQKGCPDDDHFHYNTNVAFDRNGTLLAKYHKEHLFEEHGMDVPTEKQDPTFKCDMGRFAMFVCFDIIFQRIVEVSHWNGIDAVLLPTMWLNANPLFNSIQYFQSWAIGNNVTLLAANVHMPGIGGLGSVIADGSNGAQVYTFNPDGQSKLLIADIHHQQKFSNIMIITKNESRKWHDDGKDVHDICSVRLLHPPMDVYKEYRCYERDTKNFTLVKLLKPSGHIDACNNGMCCSLEYTAQYMKENFYLGVFNGTYNSVNRYFFEEENCFLARCDDFKGDRCVTFPMRSNTIFYSIDLMANFSAHSIYPSVMSTKMRLVPTKLWKFKTVDQVASISFQSSGTDLLMVGLKGRCYDRDPPYKP